MKFRNWSVRRKLMVLMMAASTAALLLACAVLLGYDLITARQMTAAHLSTLAQIIGDNSKAALSFGDQAAAGEVLAALKAEGHITAAYIYDQRSAPLASYHAQGTNNSSAPALRSPGTYFESDRLLLCRRITLGAEEIGSVYIESDTADVSERYRRYAGMLAAVMVLSWLAALLAASRLHRTITGPLVELIQVAREIGESGDLDQNIQIDRKDELGELARSFSVMVVYLKEMAGLSEAIARGDLTMPVQPRSPSDTLGRAFANMLGGLRGIVVSVRDAAAQVANGSRQVANASGDSAKAGVTASAAIDEVTGTIEEMNVNVQHVAANTQVQASSVSETSSSIQQMVVSIQRVTDTANMLVDISNRSRQEVQSGIATMEKATDGLTRINDSIDSSAAMIAALGQRVEEIGKIVEVIDDISEQTNLLALNAAIEAARAGEHGLGFAVVADEVRKLAEKSAESTKEISELIRNIQKEARRTVENMQKSTTVVNEGLSMGSELSTALKKISSVVSEVNRFAQEIGSATNEQSRGSSQIASATTRLNEITEEINSSVQEQSTGAKAVAKAMESMRDTIQAQTTASAELAASAEQMSKMSQHLLESTDRFILDAERNPLADGRKPRPFGLSGNPQKVAVAKAGRA
jgi:methyl-accepting chemotaxis protein